jgi:hypothetical protein
LHSWGCDVIAVVLSICSLSIHKRFAAPGFGSFLFVNSDFSENWIWFNGWTTAAVGKRDSYGCWKTWH